MKNVSIKAKLMLLILFPTIGVLASLALALSELRAVKDGVDRIYKDRVVPLEDLKLIADDYAVLVIDSLNKANAGLQTTEAASKDIKAALDSINQRWKKYTATELTAEEEKLVKEAEALFTSANSSIDSALKYLSSKPGNREGQLDQIDGPLYSTIDPISEKITELVSLQLRVAKQEDSMISSKYEAQIFVLTALAIVVISFLFVLGTLIYRSIVNPLKEMQKVISNISDNHDFTLIVKSTGTQELDIIGESFNNMVNHLREVVGQIVSTAGQLTSSADSLATISVEANNSIHDQQGEIQQVATAMNEMVSTAQDISNNASNADEEARKTRDEATSGNLVVSEAVESTTALVHDVQEVSDRIEKLKEDSNNIGTVVDVIRGIAEQTNLLALNAAIEAARAGDQGRGFAVVADEVRSLAQRTQISTTEIQEAIVHLQAGTEKAVEAMGSGRTRAEEAGEKALLAGEALHRISDSIQGITDRNAQIALASGQQTEVSDAVNQSLVNINDVSNRSSDDASKLASESEELLELARELTKVVSQFKV